MLCIAFVLQAGLCVSDFPNPKRSAGIEVIQFSDDSAVLPIEPQKERVYRLRDVLLHNPTKDLLIAGYADPAEVHDACDIVDQYLIALSERRATSMAVVLLDSYPEFKPRVHIIAMGSDDHDSEPAKNRVAVATLVDGFVETPSPPISDGERAAFKKKVEASLSEYEKCRKARERKSAPLHDRHSSDGPTTPRTTPAQGASAQH